MGDDFSPILWQSESYPIRSYFLEFWIEWLTQSQKRWLEVISYFPWQGSLPFGRIVPPTGCLKPSEVLPIHWASSSSFSRSYKSPMKAPWQPFKETFSLPKSTRLTPKLDPGSLDDPLSHELPGCLLVCYGSPDKLSSVLWIKTTEIYSHSSRGQTSKVSITEPKSKCCQGPAASERENPFLATSSFCLLMALVSPWFMWLCHSSLRPCGHMVFSSVCVKFPSACLL